MKQMEDWWAVFVQGGDMTERKRMISGKLYNPYMISDNPWAEIRAACKKFNESDFWSDKSALDELKKHFAEAGEDMVLTSPFYCDHGDKSYFGKHFYANTGLTILDENAVIFGDDVFPGPHVSIYTAGHPLSAEVRNLELEYARAVKIGDSVWIGAGVTVLPGVAIGNNAVIGAGSVVNRDIPDGVVAAGNPCRVIRRITDADREKYKIWH